MKKIISLTLAILQLVLLITSCTSNKKNNTDNNMNTDNMVVYESLVNWVTYGYDKVRGDQKPKGELVNSGEVYLAKNGAEGIQLCLYNTEDLSDITFSLKNGANENITYNLYLVRYVTKSRGRLKHSDPMLDYKEGEKLSLVAKESLCLYVEFNTTKETPAGKYSYTFVAKNSSGKEIANYNIDVNVWNFAYPDAPAIDTAIAISTKRISDWYGFCDNELYKRFYDYLLEHYLCGYTLPYDILDPRADAYMSDPRVTSFAVPFGQHNNDYEKTDEIYAKLLTNPEWIKKAFIYPLDEPRNQEHFDYISQYYPEFKERWPELRIVTPFYTNLQVSETEDQLDFLSKYVDLLCPKLNMYGTEDEFPNYYERLMAIRESGKKVWTYVCNKPLAPYSNVLIDMSGLNNRLVFWQAYQYNADGFLYWSAIAWKNPDSYNGDVWVDGGAQYECWGDGFFIYPGLSKEFLYKFRRLNPYPSIRLKIIRDGIEDYGLLTMAEELFGRDWVMAKINEITPNLTTVNVNDDGFNAIRVAIGNAISEAQN